MNVIKLEENIEKTTSFQVIKLNQLVNIKYRFGHFILILIEYNK